MVVHLSRVYDLPLSRKEAGSIVRVIVAESAALMGTVWALHFVSSALKVGTIGLSTILTAGAQGAIAYYSTYLVGRAAAEYLAEGKSWGEGGPKKVVKEILDSLDRDTVLRDAKREIQARSRAELDGSARRACGVSGRRSRTSRSGCVANYGQVAEIAGIPRGARQVGYALRQYAGRSVDLPWHRVIQSSGKSAFEAGTVVLFGGNATASPTRGS